METRELTCIGCPIGCALFASVYGDCTKITGNLCKIGIEYGINEVTDPRRAITTSIKVKFDNGTTKILSLKTSKDIPKDKIFECLKEIRNTKVNRSFRIGDIVIENILGTGIDIVATREISKLLT